MINSKVKAVYSSIPIYTKPVTFKDMAEVKW